MSLNTGVYQTISINLSSKRNLFFEIEVKNFKYLKCKSSSAALLSLSTYHESFDEGQDASSQQPIPWLLNTIPTIINYTEFAKPIYEQDLFQHLYFFFLSKQFFTFTFQSLACLTFDYCL